MSKAKKAVKFDAGKPRLSKVPRALIEGVAEALEFGSRKYGWDQWKSGLDDNMRFMDAALRHMYKFLDGEIYDDESGHHHLKHAACNLGFLLHFIAEEEKATPKKKDK